MGTMGLVAMASSKAQMRVKHGLFITPQSTAPVLAMTAGIRWFSYWELIVMEVPISVALWLGLMLIVSQVENEPEKATYPAYFEAELPVLNLISSPGSDRYISSHNLVKLKLIFRSHTRGTI
jgi:hypothetical protein